MTSWTTIDHDMWDSIAVTTLQPTAWRVMFELIRTAKAQSAQGQFDFDRSPIIHVSITSIPWPISRNGLRAALKQLEDHGIIRIFKSAFGQATRIRFVDDWKTYVPDAEAQDQLDKKATQVAQIERSSQALELRRQLKNAQRQPVPANVNHCAQEVQDKDPDPSVGSRSKSVAAFAAHEPNAGSVTSNLNAPGPGPTAGAGGAPPRNRISECNQGPGDCETLAELRQWGLAHQNDAHTEELDAAYEQRDAELFALDQLSREEPEVQHAQERSVFQQSMENSSAAPYKELAVICIQALGRPPTEANLRRTTEALRIHGPAKVRSVTADLIGDQTVKDPFAVLHWRLLR